VHHGDWQIRLGDDRRPELIPPRGSTPTRNPDATPTGTPDHRRAKRHDRDNK